MKQKAKVVELSAEEFQTLKEGMAKGVDGDHWWRGIITPAWRKRLVPQAGLVMDGILNGAEILWCGERIWGSYPTTADVSKAGHPLHAFRNICLKVAEATEIRIPQVVA